VTTANTFQNIQFNNAPILANWTHPTPETFVCSLAGRYYVCVRAEVDFASTSTANFSFAVRGALNGAEITGSQVGTTLPGNTTIYQKNIPINSDFIVNATVGDILSIQYTGSGAGATSPRIGGTGPSSFTPISASLTLFYISN
jgi:hypothetical protein